MKDRGVTIRDASVTSNSSNDAKNEDYIKSGILAPGINWAGKILVIITPDTCNHPWVDWEIEYAKKCGGKEIIGVWAPGSEGCELPEALERHADSIVTWDAQKICDALNGIRQWDSPNGLPRSRQVISRVGCD
jgi:MTH538 TIR-like domain (DUF1863)